MGKRIYNQKHIEYLRKISSGRYNDEITKMFNKKFGMNATESAISSLRERHGVKLTVPNARRKYTDEQLGYLEKLSNQGLFNSEITKKFNKRFGTNKTESAIQNIRAKYNIKTNARNYWPKGHTPWNKGKKGWTAPGSERTQFKKGNKPPNRVPVGTERINVDGYVEVKVQDGKKNRNWKGKHIFVWEHHHGQAVPPGHVVIFGDGNNRNFDPENLLLVSRAQLVRMNQKRLIKDNAELTKTGIIIADIYNKIGERKKENLRS
jgi:hypothetical protein